PYDVADQAEPKEAEAVTETQDRIERAPSAVTPGKILLRPIYLETPDGTRPAPEPLELPQEPTPSRQVKLSEGVSSQYQEKITEKANTRLDLDKVLKRRRAI